MIVVKLGTKYHHTNDTSEHLHFMKYNYNLIGVAIPHRLEKASLEENRRYRLERDAITKALLFTK